MKQKSKSTIILLIIFFIGLSLLLYPTISDYWNSLRQSRAIAEYVESLNKLDAEKYEQLIEEARQYNMSLLGNDSRFSPTEEEKAEFLSLLDSTGGAVGYLEISSIKLTIPVYMGTGESVLQVGAGIMEGASIPIGGENTHAALTGHRGLPSATLFTNLDRLVVGDLFSVHILNETCTYEIDQILIVEPQDITALGIEEGKDLCTLITCTPYGVNSHRMLVRGHRVETSVDSATSQVPADALQIEPLVIAPLVAVPLIIILLIFLLGGRKRPKSSEAKHSRAKKGGISGDDDQKMDR